MEAIVEFVVTFLIELFFDGCIDIFTSRKVSMPLRILAVEVFVVVVGGLFWLFFWIAVNANVFLGGMLALFELFLVGCIIYAVRKRILHRKNESEQCENTENREVL